MQQREAFTTTSQTNQELSLTTKWRSATDSVDQRYQHTIADTLQSLQDAAKSIARTEWWHDKPFIGRAVAGRIREHSKGAVSHHLSLLRLDDLTLILASGQEMRSEQGRAETEYAALEQELASYLATKQHDSAPGGLGDRTVCSLARLSDLSEELASYQLCGQSLDKYDTFITAAHAATTIHEEWAKGKLDHRGARKAYRQVLDEAARQLDHATETGSTGPSVSFTAQTTLGRHALLATGSRDTHDPLTAAFIQAFPNIREEQSVEAEAAAARIGDQLGALLGLAALSSLTLRHQLDSGTTTIALNTRRAPML